MHVERASFEDLRDIWLVDEQVRGHTNRRRQLMDAVERKQCMVAKQGFTVLGYAVRDNTFFGYPFIAMLLVHPAHRDKHVTEKLLDYIEMTTPEDRLFTSVAENDTDDSTTYEALGFQRSGEVYNVDEDGITRIIYMKRLT
ncbi:MAG: GNAT family N-acetyltransferase [Chloroflexota bacterium]